MLRRRFPKAFVGRYSQFIPDFDAFLDAMQRPLRRTFRVNTLKATRERVLELMVDLKPEPLPWFDLGFALPENGDCTARSRAPGDCPHFRTESGQNRAILQLPERGAAEVLDEHVLYQSVHLPSAGAVPHYDARINDIADNPRRVPLRLGSICPWSFVLCHCVLCPVLSKAAASFVIRTSSFGIGVLRPLILVVGCARAFSRDHARTDG